MAQADWPGFSRRSLCHTYSEGRSIDLLVQNSLICNEMEHVIFLKYKDLYVAHDNLSFYFSLKRCRP
ncbi:hypothetical protein C173_04366 [Paenibacillus sp. FSL R7-277]|nr:hypothetical protein C173_04366 [Paenibacillus sp. FSL R7-277]